jgi:uncharacterized membrane protein YesL
MAYDTYKKQDFSSAIIFSLLLLGIIVLEYDNFKEGQKKQKEGVKRGR